MHFEFLLAVFVFLPRDFILCQDRLTQGNRVDRTKIAQ